MKKTALSMLAFGAIASTAVMANPSTASAAVDTTAACSAMSTPIYQRDAHNRSLLTKWKTEADGAVKYGFNVDKGSPFKASTKSTTGLVPIHRLYNANSTDFVWMPEGSEMNSAISKYGYKDQGINFYASPNSMSCTTPVYRVQKSGTHKFTSNATERDKYLAQGWREGGVVFHVAKNDTIVSSSGTLKNVNRRLPKNINPAGDADGKFSLAVEPDTQGETQTYDKRMQNRSADIVKNKAAKDYRYMIHGGDVVNWGWLVPSQLTVASEAMKTLENSGLPYSLSLGNHDTAAVGFDPYNKGPGGAAYTTPENMPVCLANLDLKAAGVPCDTRALVRYTKQFNDTFTTDRFGASEGVYEAGKVDNSYSTFEAAGKKFLVLNLEFNARNGAIDWANKVADAHKDHNIILVTHSYLDGSPNVSGNAEYGDNSGKNVWDKLVSRKSNIVMTFSGHVGTHTHGVSTRADGSKVVNFMTTMHAKGDTPLRDVEIDVVNGTVKSDIKNVATGTTYSGSNSSFGGIKFI